MKKLFALTAIAGAFAATAVQADDLATVYGQLNVTVQHTDVDIDIKNNDVLNNKADYDRWEALSNASRLGVKGAADLGSGLSAIYQLEFGVDVTDEDKEKNFTARNQFVGLKGGFGQLIMGRSDTPLKTSQGKVDQFNDLVGDIDDILPGEVRANNIIVYSTPAIANVVTVNVAVVPGESTAKDGDNGFADSVSASVVFDSNGLYLAAAVDSDVKSKISNSISSRQDEVFKEVPNYNYVPWKIIQDVNFDNVRLTAGYKLDAFEFGALYQKSETSENLTYSLGATKYDLGTLEADTYLLSAKYSVGDIAFKGQYGNTSYEFTNEKNIDGDLSTLSFGVDYALGKKTTAGVFFTQLERDASQETMDATATTLGLGLLHKF